jgi:hypothetical protein
VALLLLAGACLSPRPAVAADAKKKVEVDPAPRAACAASERTLADLYGRIVEKYKDDAVFLQNLEITQVEWEKQFNAEIKAVFHCANDNSPTCFHGTSEEEYFSFREYLVRERIGRLRKVLAR